MNADLCIDLKSCLVTHIDNQHRHTIAGDTAGHASEQVTERDRDLGIFHH